MTPLIAVLAVATLPVSAGTQKSTPVFPTSLDLVHLTVTVRDQSGRLVSDLTQADFTILEDGRRRDVVLFARSVDPGEEETLALDLGLLMDTSGSMRQVLKITKESAARFLDTIPRAHELFAIFFDQDIRISRYDSESQQGLFDRIFSLDPKGNTALYDAMTVYLSRIRNSPGRKVLVMFTDAEDNASNVTLPEVMRLLRSSPVTVYPIAVNSGKPGSVITLRSMIVLQDMADATGGRVFYPSRGEAVANVYQTILDELSSQYVLGFAPGDMKDEGRLRRLKVRTSREGLKVRHRDSYYLELVKH